MWQGCSTLGEIRSIPLGDLRHSVDKPGAIFIWQRRSDEVARIPFWAGKAKQLRDFLDSWWDCWRASLGLSSIQTCQEHVVSHLCAQMLDHSGYNMVRQMAHMMWFEVWRGIVKNMDINGTLEKPCGPMWVSVMKSRMKHSMRDMGFCQCEPWRKKCEWVLQRDSFLPDPVCLYERRQYDKKNDEGALLVSVKHFLTYFMHTTEGVKDSNGDQQNAWIVFVACYPLQYINNARHLEGYVTRELVQEAK